MAEYSEEQKQDQTQEDQVETKDKISSTEEPQKEKADSFKPIQISGKDASELMQKQEQIVSECIGKFAAWEIWRKPYEDLWNSIYKLYIGIADAQKTPTRAKIFVPVVFQVIEATIPKILNVVFGQEEFFDVVPTNKKDEPLADIIKILLQYQLIQADFFIKFMDFCKQLCLYGTSYFKVYWKVTRKWVYSRVPVRATQTLFGFTLGSKIVSWKETKEFKTVERRPEIDVIDVLDVFPEPDSVNEKNCSGIFIRSWLPIDELKDLGRGRYPVYANTENESLITGEMEWTTSRQVRLSSRGVSSPPTIRKNMVEILEYWGVYDLDGDGFKEECQIVIANRKVLLRALSNPFHHQKKPIIKSTLFPVPLEWFGMGLVEPVIPLVHELNTLRRQRLDNINMAINRMWKVLSYADIDLDTVVSSPNGIILTDDMDAVAPLLSENVTDKAYLEAQVVQTDIEQTTAPKSIQGSPENGSLGRTARGAQMIITQALEKFGTAVKLVEETAVKRILRMFHQLNLQFIDDDDILRDPGLYGHLFQEEITPEMIRAEVQFKMIGISDIIGKEGKINQIISFMGVFGKVLSPETITQLSKKVWALMGFNPDDIDIQAVAPSPEAGGAEEAILNQIQNQPAAGGVPAVPNSPLQGL